MGVITDDGDYIMSVWEYKIVLNMTM